MTGSALNFASKLVVLHVKLENMNHGVLLVEVPGTHKFVNWIGLKNLAYKHVKYNIVCALYPEIPYGGGGDGIHI